MSKTFEFVLSKTQKLNEDKDDQDTPTKSHIQVIYEQEKTLFLKMKMKELIRKEWNEGLIYKDFKDHYDATLERTDNGLYYWVTVNPQKNITYKELKKEVERYVKRTFIKSYIYVYEQRGSAENDKNLGEGLHCHILLERDMSANVSPYDIQKRTRVAFKKVCDSQNKSILYFKACPEEYVVDKFNYMTNKNLDDEHKDKEQKQEYDKIWREDNEIPEIVAFGSLEEKYNEYIGTGCQPNVEELNGELKENLSLRPEV